MGNITTLLFTSISLLSVMALFRWKAHDEKIAINTRMAIEFGSEFHPKKDGLSTVRLTERATFDGAIYFLRSVIKAINREYGDENNTSSLAEESDVARTLVYQFAAKQMKDYIATLENLGAATHYIRRYFNWPFYVFLFTLVLISIQRYFLFDIIVNIFIIISVMSSLYGFYCLFNFSYNPEETDGFDRLPKHIKNLRLFRKNPRQTDFQKMQQGI